MNILPKKRWHVRTKENIARVRRDQAAAAEADKVEEARRANAERESRTALMRQRAGLDETKPVLDASGAPSTSTVADASLYTSGGHVNLFAELERQERTFGGSKEHEAEARREQEDWEKKVGLLKYLGDGSGELNGEVPWYQRKPDEGAVARARANAAKPVTKCDLPAILQRRSTGDESASTTAAATPVEHKKESAPSDERKRRRRKKAEHREKKKKKEKGEKEKKLVKKKRKRKREEGSEGEREAEEARARDKIRRLAALREDRLRREADERLRAQQVLRKARGEPEPEPAASNRPPAYKQKYNSQFNPELARQNVPRPDR